MPKKNAEIIIYRNYKWGLNPIYEGITWDNYLYNKYC